MDNESLQALRAQILGNALCVPLAITAEMPKVAGSIAAQQDQAIADIINVGRTRLKPHVVTERGVRAALSITDGALFIKTLRDLSHATEAPAWLTAVLTAIGVPAKDQWAYLDTLQCGFPWLLGDGLDVGEATVRQLLDLLAAGVPALASATSALKALGVEPDPVSGSDVSIALRNDIGE